MLVALLFWSCIPEEKYSVIPRIEFVSLEKIPNTSGSDDKGMLIFYFEDGDGDIGLNSEGDDLRPPFDILPSITIIFSFIITKNKMEPLSE